MRIAALILFTIMSSIVWAQRGIGLDQIEEAPGRDYIALSKDTLNSIWPINGILEFVRLRDSLYIKGDSLCHGIFGDGRPDPCVLLPEGGGGAPGDSTYYFIIQVNSGADDTITTAEKIHFVPGGGVALSYDGQNLTISSTIVDTETDIDSVKLIGSTLHIYEDDKDRSADLSSLVTSQDTQSLVPLTDSTFGLTYPNSSVVKDTVLIRFSSVTPVGDTYVDSARVQSVGLIDTIWMIRDSAGVSVDSFYFVLEDSINNQIPDTHVDTGRVTSSVDGLVDTLWYVRDSAGVSVDSFFIVVNDNVDGNGVGVDSYADSAFHLIDTLTVFRYKDGVVIDSFATEVDDDDWYNAVNDRAPDNIDQTIYSGTTASKRVIIGQDSTATGYGGVSPNLMINAGVYPLGTYSRLIPVTLWRQVNSENEYFDRVQQGGQAYIRLGDHDTQKSGVYILMNVGYNGINPIMVLDSAIVSFRTDDAQLYGYPNTRDDGEPIDSLLNIYYAGSEGELHQMPWSQVAASVHDFDFIQVPDTSIMGLAGRIPLDSTDIDTIIYRSGAVIIGDSVNRDTSYKGGYVLIDSADPLLNLNGQRNALDLFDQNAVEMYLRNRQADFILRNHNNDPLIFNDTLETYFELAVNSYLNQVDTVDFREVMHISSRASESALDIEQEYIRMSDYGTGQDTLVKDSVLAVLVPDATGKLHRVSRDTLNAALNVAASAPQEIDTFSIVNDSLLLDLENTVAGIQRVDLSKYVNDTTYITGDSLIVGDSIYTLPQGADSLGTAFADGQVIYGDGTRGGSSSSTFYYDAVNGRLGIGTASPTRSITVSNSTENTGFQFTTTGGATDSDWQFQSNRNTGSVLFRDQTNSVIRMQLEQGTHANQFMIKADGYLQSETYGSGALTGTPSRFSAWDASGNFIERSPAQLLSDIGAQPAGSYDNYNAWSLYEDGAWRGGVFSGDEVDFVSGTAMNITYTSGGGQKNLIFNVNEVDGSTSNELQSYTHGGGGSAYTNTLSNGGGDFSLNAGTGISLSHNGVGDVTISTSGSSGMSSFNFGTTSSLQSITNGMEVGNRTDGEVVMGGIQYSPGNYYRYQLNIAANAVGSDDIENSSINEIDLNSSNVATNGYLLSYNSGTGGFTWVAGSGDGNGIYSNSGTLAGNRTVTMADRDFIIADEQNRLELLGNDGGTQNSKLYSPQNTIIQAGSNVQIFADNAFTGSGCDFWVNSSVGITGVGYELEVTGGAAKTSAGTTWVSTSDRRAKEKIKPIENALKKLMKIEPVEFHYNKEYRDKYGEPDKLARGYIAQDYMKVFPEDVTAPEDEDGFYTLAPDAIGPYTVAAIQEQQQIIDHQQQQIEALQDQVQILISELQKLKDESKK